MSLTGWRVPVLVGALVRVLAWSAGFGVKGGSKPALPLGTDAPPWFSSDSGDLRLVSDSYAGVALLQVGFGLAVALTYALAQRLVGAEVAAIAAWWMALSPIHVIDSSVLLTEVPFSVLLLASVVLVAPLVEREHLEGWLAISNHLECDPAGHHEEGLIPILRLGRARSCVRANPGAIHRDRHGSRAARNA